MRRKEYAAAAHTSGTKVKEERMELHVQEYKLPDAILFNFEELKTAITAKTEQYASIVYTDDNIKAAKEDRADLNRLKKALNDERIRRQKEYMKPFEAFKQQIDEIISIIEKPVLAIDRQIKEYEQIKQDEKRMLIEDMFKNMFFPEFVDLNQLWNPKWLNATTSMNQIEAELLKQKDDIIKNCQTLACLPNHSHEAVLFYQNTLDVAGALAKVTELAEIEAKAKKMIEEEAKRKEVENAFIPETEKEPVVTTQAPQEERKWIAFEALLTTQNARMLKSFFETNNITFRAIMQGGKNAANE